MLQVGEQRLLLFKATAAGAGSAGREQELLQMAACGGIARNGGVKVERKGAEQAADASANAQKLRNFRKGAVSSNQKVVVYFPQN